MKSPSQLEERQFVFPPSETGPGVARRVASNNPFLSPSNLSPGGHFRDLKERLLAKKSGIGRGGGKGDEPQTIEEKEDGSDGDKTPQRVVKSFNEFLNFASASTKMQWQARRGGSQEEGQQEARVTSEGKEKGDSDAEEEGEEEESSPDDTQEYFPMTTSITRELRLELENLDRQVFGVDGYKKLSHLSTDTYEEEEEDQRQQQQPLQEISKCPEAGQGEMILANGLKAQIDLEKRLSTCSINDVFVWENPLNQFPSSGSIGSLTENVEVETVAPQLELPPGLSMFVDPLELSNQMGNSSCEEAAEAAAALPLNMASIRVPGTLPAPPEFGGGNPFLMFLSLTLLLQHRDYVMKNGLDYNETAMYFDKMVRRHNVTKTLNQARQMYSDYLASFKGRLGVSGEDEGMGRVV